MQRWITTRLASDANHSMFIKQEPRPYSREAILAVNKEQIGVYGIFQQNLWIYVGKGDIRQRLLDHLNGDIPGLNRHNPTHWVAEVTAGDPSNREKELIIALQPRCNQRVG